MSAVVISPRITDAKIREAARKLFNELQTPRATPPVVVAVDAQSSS